MSNIYLIRHGFTPANNASYNNQTGLRQIAEDKDMPLEKIYGVKQAEELGKFLSTIKGKTKIYVSPYKRAIETLEIALKYMPEEYDIELVDDIHEIYSDIHYAKTKDELLSEFPDAIKFYEKFAKDPFNTKYIGGESKYDVRDRVKNISQEIINVSNSNEYDNIFIFAHGEVNKWIYYHINNELFNFSQKNCEVILANGINKGKIVFTPKTFVPIGFLVNIDDYKYI